MKNKFKTPKYVRKLIKNNTNIISGRKNFDQHHTRVLKTIKIIKKYFNFKY